MKKKYLGLFLLLTIFYFEYSVTILWDSAHYMSYVNIFEGVLPWSSWDVVRGPIFPLIIYFGNILFGKSSQGLIINTYIYYLLMLIFSYKLLLYFFDKVRLSKNKMNKLIVVIMFLIIINPIIFGFCHTLLTEFVAIALSVVSCYLAILWVDCDYDVDTKNFIWLSIYFILFTTIAWFLKQPYVSVVLFVFIIALIINIFQVKKFKNTIYRIGVLVLCLVFLVISMQGWNAFLRRMGNDPDSDRNPSNALGNQLILAIDSLKIDNNYDEISDIHYINYSKLSDEEKAEVKKLIKKKKEYLIINHYKGKKIKEADYLLCDDGNVSTMEALKYIFSLFVRHPVRVGEAYFTNYMSLIDVYSTSSLDGVGYYSNRKIDLLFSSEIATIGFRPYIYGSSNIFYMLPEMYDRVSNYEQANYTFKGLNIIMRILGKIYLLLFKLLFLFLPLLLIISIIVRMLSRGSINDKKCLNLIIILLGFSFLHVMLHTVTGAILDRYIVPVFIPTFLGTVMFFGLIIHQKKIGFK